MNDKIINWILDYDIDAFIDRVDAKAKKFIFYFLTFSAGYFLASILRHL
jgi:hypothetical protein